MKIIAIGGSAGSLDVLKQIASKLPTDFPCSVFIVMHLPSGGQSLLPDILNFKGKMKSKFAEDNEIIETGKIYIAPNDFHLVLESGKMRLTTGPKENWFRPAIDVLFRSAAASYGPEVAAIVLSGNLYDGTAGLWAVKEHGGITIVQDPEEAAFSSMPSSAMKNVEVDYCVPASEIEGILQNIVCQKSENKIMEKSEAFQWELEIANGKEPTLEEMKKFGTASRFICPQCDGPLFEINIPHYHQYRCVVGHAFSVDSVRESVWEKVDYLMAATYRTLEDKRALLDLVKDESEQLNREKADVDNQIAGLKKLMNSSI